MNLKELAGRRAVDYVESGMRLGLGSGTTIRYTLEEIGSRLADGRLRDIVGVPTSEQTAALASALRIPLADLNDLRRLDLAIDGADEVDPHHQLVKGLGGAALREKIVAAAADRLVIVVDESKMVARLGTRAPLPVEVASFGWSVTAEALRRLGCNPVPRRHPDGALFKTDNGNYVIDCRFPDGIGDAHALAQRIALIPGALGHGLFLDFAPTVIVSRNSGLEILTPP